ncbi:MAG: hypothetical protein LBV79_11270 [Candidatus Adiutrix sp.]|jgi:apolipoprotein N-acyltransferase|nr:hypothetical protein [Candidatus Adiutrix sp.]
MAEAQKKLFLPMFALFLSAAMPWLSVFVPLFLRISGEFIIYAIILPPIAGILLGIAALCKGRKHTGTAGLVISCIAILTPFMYAAVVYIQLQEVGSQLEHM